MAGKQKYKYLKLLYLWKNMIKLLKYTDLCDKFNVIAL